LTSRASSTELTRAVPMGSIGLETSDATQDPVVGGAFEGLARKPRHLFGGV